MSPSLPLIRSLVAFAVLAVLVLVTGERAQAGGTVSWSEPEVIVGPRQPAGFLELGAGPGGYAVVAWVGGPPRPTGNDPWAPFIARVHASVRPPGAARFRTPRSLSPRTATDVELAVAPNGQTVLTWLNRRGQLTARFRSPTEGWSTPERINAHPAFVGTARPDLAVGPDGTAVLVWRAEDPPRLKAAVRLAEGRFHQPETLARAFGAGRYAADVAEGQAAVAWARPCVPGVPVPARNARVSFLGHDHALASPLRVATSRCSNAGLDLALDGRGKTVLLVEGHRFHQGIKASYGDPAQGFTPAEPIEGKGRANFAELGMDADGRATAIWSPIRKARGDHPAGLRGIAAAFSPPGGPFGTPARISNLWAGGANDLAVNDAGGALAAWRSERTYQLEASYMPPGGAFGPPEPVSPPLNPSFGVDPHPALSPDGEALVAWMDTPIARTGVSTSQLVERRMSEDFSGL